MIKMYNNILALDLINSAILCDWDEACPESAGIEDRMKVAVAGAYH